MELKNKIRFKAIEFLGFIQVFNKNKIS